MTISTMPGHSHMVAMVMFLFFLANASEPGVSASWWGQVDGGSVWECVSASEQINQKHIEPLRDRITRRKHDRALYSHIFPKNWWWKSLFPAKLCVGLQCFTSILSHSSYPKQFNLRDLPHWWTVGFRGILGHLWLISFLKTPALANLMGLYQCPVSAITRENQKEYPVWVAAQNEIICVSAFILKCFHIVLEPCKRTAYCLLQWYDKKKKLSSTGSVFHSSCFS